MNEESMKRCIKCEREFPATKKFFYANKDCYDGLLPRCKDCHGVGRQKRRVIQEGYQWCPGCQQEFLATTENFYPVPSRKSGLYVHCKTCCSQRNIEKYAQAKEQREEKKSARPATWICESCQEEKPFHEGYFSPNVRCRYGLRTTCKVCGNEVHKDYVRNLSPEKREKRRVQVYGYSKQRVPYFQERYQQNRETILAQQEAFKQAHPEIVSGWKQKYSKSPKGRMKHIANAENRRALEQQLEGFFTPKDIQDQYKRQKGKCYWCQCKLHNKYEVDHIIPVSRPGSTNWPDNLVLACKHCNTSRRNKLPHEWPQGGRLL